MVKSTDKARLDIKKSAHVEEFSKDQVLLSDEFTENSTQTGRTKGWKGKPSKNTSIFGANALDANGPDVNTMQTVETANVSI